MSNSIQGNSDSQPSFSWPRRLAIAACLIVGCVFSLRAMTPDVAAKVTSGTSQQAELQASIGLTVPVDGDVKLVTKNIEDIQAGDLVLARDEHGSAIGLKPVKDTYQRVSQHLRHLTFETPDGKQQTLSTTDEHPFWSVTAEEFVEAGSLIVGHSVGGPTGETQTLVSSAREEFSKGVPVFNFQVTDYHTYFVAASADTLVMLVHNADYTPNKTVVNLGGEGEYLPGLGETVINVQPSFNGRSDLLTEKLRRIREKTNQAIVVANGDALPFATGSIDKIVANDIPIGLPPNHFGVPPTLDEILRVLKPGGETVGNSF